MNSSNVLLLLVPFAVILVPAFFVILDDIIGLFKGE